MGIIKNLFSKMAKQEQPSPVVVKKTVVKTVKKTVVEKPQPKPVETPVEAPAVKKQPQPEYNAQGMKQFKNLVVCIDPGHAVTTPGKRSPFSLGKQSNPALPLEEWKFNREVAQILKGMLEKNGVEVFISTDEARDKQIDVSLTTRATRCVNYIKQSGKRGIVVSIHGNAHGNGSEWTSAKGWSAYTTKGQNISDELAECMYDYAEQIFKEDGLTIRTHKADGDRDWEENFTIIYKTELLSKNTVPAVLTESFFYTNINDTMYMASERGKQRIAFVHLKGILSFAEKFWNM